MLFLVADTSYIGQETYKTTEEHKKLNISLNEKAKGRISLVGIV